ncbi:MAG: hypothetical protein JST16_14225 [Bdellovibrionales bacterium]|nr:hypothetical protein [Bdellovibrionales bacterium]
MKRSHLLKNYYACCFRADLRPARKLLKGHSFPIEQKFHRRFGERVQESIRGYDPLVRDIIRAYRSYYGAVLMRDHPLAKAERMLKTQLTLALRSYGCTIRPSASFESIEKMIEAALRKRGFYSRPGTVSPFRNILIWKGQSTRSYSVHLPLGRRQVRVRCLKNFVELGWMHYASFGRYYVGGWADKDELFCVDQAWKGRELDFRVSFLIHEAQHFDDYRRFPKLKGKALEYRAKLCELIYHPKPLKVWRHFKTMAANDAQNPHAWAAYKIVSGLGDVSSAMALKTQARFLFEADSQRYSK